MSVQSIWAVLALRPHAVLVGTCISSWGLSRHDEDRSCDYERPLKTKQRPPVTVYAMSADNVPALAVTVDTFNIAARHMDE